MASHKHRHVVHFNCLTVWSNSKWICDLSIDSFSPRLWIKCFNYWCTDVRCPLECCMWCRPLSPGKLLPPPHHHPSSIRQPHAPPSWRPYLAWMELEHVAGSAQTGVNQCKELNAKIKSGSLYLSASPPLHLLQSSPPGACVCHAIEALLLGGATSISSKLHLKRAVCVEMIEYWVSIVCSENILVSYCEINIYHSVFHRDWSWQLLIIAMIKISVPFLNVFSFSKVSKNAWPCTTFVYPITEHRENPK